MGSGYVIETCISAFLDNKKRRLYEEYVTECLRIIAKNTAMAGHQGGEREYVTVHYRDMIKTDKPQKDTRTGEEIISDIKAKFAKLMEGGDGDGDNAI